MLCKAHPGHPGTSALVASIISAAVADTGLPAGTFGLVQTASVALATRLVGDERIEAVGFTGSIPGGRAIFDAAAARPRPIPVFAEMGSVNPVVVTAAAARERAGEIASALAGAVTRDAGQLCTKPGLVFVPAGRRRRRAPRGRSASGCRTPRRRSCSARGCATASGRASTRSSRRRGRWRVSAAAPRQATGRSRCPRRCMRRRPRRCARTRRCARSGSGRSRCVARYADLDDLLATLGGLAGQLTGTIHLGSGDDEDRAAASAIVDRLVARVGRVVVNGVPTGVVVTGAQFHGGPYPATTASATTSVGSLAIRRFLRPVAFQNAPQWLLPEPLRD